MADDHDKVAFRLATILQKLNQGEILVEKELAEELAFVPFSETCENVLYFYR